MVLGFPWSWGYPHNGRFRRENPIKIPYTISLADIMNITVKHHEQIRNRSWTDHEDVPKSQPSTSQDWPFSPGFFPRFSAISARMLPPSGGSTAPEELCPSCGNVPTSDGSSSLEMWKTPMKFEWKMEPHSSQNRRCLFGRRKTTFFDAQKGPVWGLKPQILAYFCWYSPVFCCSRWLLVLGCSFLNERV